MQLPERPAFHGDSDAVAFAIWEWYLDLVLYVDSRGDTLAAEPVVRELISESKERLVPSSTVGVFDRRNAWLAHFESLLGCVLDRLGRHVEAQRLLGSAVSRSPELAEHRINLIKFLLERDCVDEAVHQFSLLPPKAKSENRRTISDWMTTYPTLKSRIVLSSNAAGEC